MEQQLEPQLEQKREQILVDNKWVLAQEQELDEEHLPVPGQPLESSIPQPLKSYQLLVFCFWLILHKSRLMDSLL